MKKIQCELTVGFNSTHLQHIFVGFSELQQSGIVDLKVSRENNKKSISYDKPVLKVVIDGTYRVIYDVLDGYNFIDGNTKESLACLSSFLNDTDFYFKRSYNKEMMKEIEEEKIKKVYPLGLNYPMDSKSNISDKIFLRNRMKKSITKIINSNSVLAKLFSKYNTRCCYRKFEYYPIQVNEEPSILFSVRLWDPKKAGHVTLEEERYAINSMRIECIKQCKKEFGKTFNGGVTADEFSCKYFKEYVLETKDTTKQKYVNAIKEHDICITSTGLHGSIPWKMGEYVAAGRAIVSEKLNYALPGSFLEEQNYLQFSTPTNLIEKIYMLIKNNELMRQIMYNNYEYYQSYVRPDMLILNTLLKITS